MEARFFRLALGLASIVGLITASVGHAQFGNQRFVAHSQNFIVFAGSDQLAREVSAAAEKHREDLAEHWLGQPLPPWSSRCPVHVVAGPQLGAGGETRFALQAGQVGNWMMSVQGTPERIIDSVLPHEITHTILASYFAALNKHVPRWADEGASTTVEHPAEKNKHNHFLEQFLRTGQGLSFNRMFNLKEYPDPILPLYAQGHSVVQFLLDQGGPRKFIAFIEDGLRTEDWEGSVRRAYEYKTLGEFKQYWNQWLADGRPDITLYAPSMKRAAENLAAAAASPAARSVGASTALAATTQGNVNSIAAGTPFELGNESWYRTQLKNHVAQSAASADPATDSSPPTSAAIRPLPSNQSPSPPSLMTSQPQALASGRSQPLALASGRFGATKALPAGSAYGSQETPLSSGRSRPLPAEGPRVQVLDWGAAQPPMGLQAVMVPLPAAIPALGPPDVILR